MRLYWTIHSLPELKHLSREERGRVFQACRFRCLKERRSWVGWITIALAGGVLSYYTISMRIEPYATILTALVGAITGGAIGHWGMQRTRPHLRDYLNRNQACADEEAASNGQPRGRTAPGQPSG